MPIGVFGGVNGNPFALEAVLDDMDDLRIERRMCIGGLPGWIPMFDQCLSIMRLRPFEWISGDCIEMGMIEQDYYLIETTLKEALAIVDLTFQQWMHLLERREKNLIVNSVFLGLGSKVPWFIDFEDDELRNHLYFERSMARKAAVHSRWACASPFLLRTNGNVLSKQWVRSGDTVPWGSQSDKMIMVFGEVGVNRSNPHVASYAIVGEDGIVERRVEYDPTRLIESLSKMGGLGKTILNWNFKELIKH